MIAMMAILRTMLNLGLLGFAVFPGAGRPTDAFLHSLPFLLLGFVCDLEGEAKASYPPTSKGQG